MKSHTQFLAKMTLLSKELNVSIGVLAVIGIIGEKGTTKSDLFLSFQIDGFPKFNDVWIEGVLARNSNYFDSVCSSKLLKEKNVTWTSNKPPAWISLTEVGLEVHKFIKTSYLQTD